MVSPHLNLITLFKTKVFPQVHYLLDNIWSIDTPKTQKAFLLGTSLSAPSFDRTFSFHVTKTLNFCGITAPQQMHLGGEDNIVYVENHDLEKLRQRYSL